MKACKFLWLAIFLLQPQFAKANEIDVIKKTITQQLPSVEGWCSEEKSNAMIDLIVDVEPEVCVEIGVFGGASILPTAMALKYLDKGVVYAIDPWANVECTKNYEEGDANHSWWSEVNLEYIYNSFIWLLKNNHIEDYCVVLQETSASASPKIPEIDILHIDGNHSEECSVFDVTTYLPKVKSGGYIWMDDFDWRTTGRAIELLREECDEIIAVDNGNCVLFQKR